MAQAVGQAEFDKENSFSNSTRVAYGLFRLLLAQRSQETGQITRRIFASGAQADSINIHAQAQSSSSKEENEEEEDASRKA